MFVSRLQGDSLSDNRSEEEHRPHISEQAVPDISCKSHNTQIRRWYFKKKIIILHVCGLMSPCLFPVFLLCIFWSSSIAWGGHSGRTFAGMRISFSSVGLCKCPPSIHHQTIKITLQPSITTFLSPSQPLLFKSQ